ncbi:MAG: flavodoxin family protein [Bacteroidales bacterium]|nr:flavodoxin family protein [Bacteroidales bacterium]
MKVLILNASPRKNGNICQMLDVIKKEFESQDIEVETINTNNLNIKPCIACMTCRKSLKCILPEDDAQKLLLKITECQVLVIGSPCFWGNIPGTLKILFDRIVYGMMGESKRNIPIGLHKGKKCIFVSTSTTPWPWNIIFKQTRGVINALKEICKYSGFKVVAKIEKGGTKNDTTINESIIKKCKKAVKKCLK